LILADGMPNGGTERQIVELLKGLKTGDYAVTTIFGVLQKGGGREQEANYWADQVLPVRQTKSLDPTYWWTIVSAVKKLHIDIVHTFGSMSDLAGLLASRIGKIPHICGSIRNARAHKNLRDRVSKFTMRFADRIVANSKAGLASYNFQKHPRAMVIYNGIDIRRIDRIQSLDFPHPYLLMVGNFTPKKDQSALIRALPFVIDKHPDLHTLLVGQGPTLPDCRKLINELGLQDNITIIPDCTTPEIYMKKARLCVLLSPDGEGLSNVVLEYLSCARAVIATDKGGNREIIDHNVNGVLVDSHDPGFLADVINGLLVNPALLDLFGQRGRKTVIEKFGLHKMIREYITLYAMLVQENLGATPDTGL
jgi:glycosyltransferase involved in cell wall biosynthesis